MLQRDVPHPWRIELEEERDVAALVGWRNEREWKHEIQRGVPIPEFDYGLLLRGPHPDYPNSDAVFKLIAGRSPEDDDLEKRRKGHITDSGELDGG